MRAKVITQDRLTCRRGPGAPFLYVYTFAPTANIELIGRMERSDWLMAQAIGGDNPCWVNGGSQYLEISGDPLALAPMDPDVVLAWSPYYGPLTGVLATRAANEVTISWHPLILTPGDDSEQTPYVIEAWLCQSGELVFQALGAYRTQLVVQDESGCAAPSRARIAGAEKHGYTPWVDIDWPPHPENN
ncbi:MAG: hypothetical protein DWG76_04835 [Chloroflexi bacterium]|nr:hypothetical protein [Chloroflexota bacterium]